MSFFFSAVSSPLLYFLKIHFCLSYLLPLTLHPLAFHIFLFASLNHFNPSFFLFYKFSFHTLFPPYPPPSFLLHPSLSLIFLPFPSPLPSFFHLSLPYHPIDFSSLSLSSSSHPHPISTCFSLWSLKSMIFPRLFIILHPPSVLFY